MKYEEAKTLTAKEFKRLSGVYPETFNKMVEIVQNYQKTKKVSIWKKILAQGKIMSRKTIITDKAKLL